MNIKIIDPDSTAIDQLVRLLQSSGVKSSITSIDPKGSTWGLTELQHKHDDFIFLDIDVYLPKDVKLLQKVTESSKSIVLVSQNVENALLAIDWQAFDFLLKPYTPKQIGKIVYKIIHKRQTADPQNPAQSFPLKKVSIPVTEGFRLIQPSTVIRCEADANFTWIHLENGEKLITCRLLHEMENKLPEGNFIKVHRSHLVNVNKVDAFLRNDGWELVLSNGQHVPVARERKEAVMRVLGIQS
ncbi:MAG: response regulator transcription factor [Saprospiraceae bacterium]|nr:response regulator transcription factor [Saprospiraceae bacterium]